MSWSCLHLRVVSSQATEDLATLRMERWHGCQSPDMSCVYSAKCPIVSQFTYLHSKATWEILRVLAAVQIPLNTSELLDFPRISVPDTPRHPQILPGTPRRPPVIPQTSTSHPPDFYYTSPRGTICQQTTADTIRQPCTLKDTVECELSTSGIICCF